MKQTDFSGLRRARMVNIYQKLLKFKNESLSVSISLEIQFCRSLKKKLCIDSRINNQKLDQTLASERGETTATDI